MIHPVTTILVVDDEPDNIHLLRGLLAGSYKIKAATSGTKALIIAAKTPVPDLILLDVMMPVMDGYQVLRELKAEPSTAAIPVVFISGHSTAEKKQLGIEAGAYDFISKPVNIDQLNKVLTTLKNR